MVNFFMRDSFFLVRNFECFKWENQIFVEFLPSFSSVILWVKYKLMTVSDFSDSFSRNHFLKGASLFNGCGLFFGWGDFIFQWGSTPWWASVLMWRVVKKIIRWRGRWPHTPTPPQLKSLLSQNSHHLNIFKPFPYFA